MPDKQIPNWIIELCSISPCIIGQMNDNSFKINWGKVAQALIIVAVITTSTSFVTVQVLKSDFANLKTNVKEDIVEMKEDIKVIKKVQLEYNDDFNAIARDIVDVSDRMDKWEDEH